MFHRLTVGASVITGLALGLILSYFALGLVFSSALKLLRRDAVEEFSTVELRMQNMADEALQVRGVLKKLGWHGKETPFIEVEAFRSQLAGQDDLEAKVAAAENLEQSLMDAEKARLAAGKASRKVRDDFYWEDAGRLWDFELGYLVKDEKETQTAVAQYNRMLAKWPLSWVAKGYHLHHMIGAAFQAMRGKAKPLAQAGQQAGLQAGRIWAKVAKQPAPGAAADIAAVPAPAITEPLARYASLPMPHFKAWAPMPEEYQEEVQYRHMPSMVVVQPEENPAKTKKTPVAE